MGVMITYSFFPIYKHDLLENPLIAKYTKQALENKVVNESANPLKMLVSLSKVANIAPSIKIKSYICILGMCVLLLGTVYALPRPLGFAQKRTLAEDYRFLFLTSDAQPRSPVGSSPSCLDPLWNARGALGSGPSHSC